MPPTPFDLLAAELNAAVNGLRGEGFRLLPMARATDVNAPAAADPDRAILDFTATYDDPGTRAGSAVEGWQVATIRKGNPGHTSDRPAVHAERSLFAVRPRQGDRLSRDATGEVFEIAEIVPAGSLFILQLHR